MNLTDEALELEEIESDHVPFPTNVKPSPPFLRIPDSWHRDLYRSERTTPEGFKETMSVRAVDEVALCEKIIPDIIAAKRPGLPAKLNAMRVVDHLTMHGRSPAIAVDALAAAMSVTNSAPKPNREYSPEYQRKIARKTRARNWSDAEAEATAKAMTTGKVGRSQRVVLHSIVRWYAEADRPLPLIVRNAVANALGLVDALGGG